MTILQILEKKYASDENGPNTIVKVIQNEIKLKSPTDGNWVDLKNGLFVKSQSRTEVCAFLCNSHNHENLCLILYYFSVCSYHVLI